MNEDFLLRFCKAPRPEFGATLYQKISHPVQTRPLAECKLAWRLALPILIVVVLTVMASPRARAQFLHVLQSMGGLWFELTGRVEPVDLTNVTVTPINSGQLDAVRGHAAFQFGVPTWVPEGFVFQDKVGHASDYSWVMLGWNKGLTSLSLLVQKDELYSQSRPVLVGSAQQVEVKHQSAVLIRGNMDLGSGRWNPDARELNLIWRQDKLVYTLTTNNPQMPIQDLIRMAESVK
jgi:hypothetical protein